MKVKFAVIHLFLGVLFLLSKGVSAQASQQQEQILIQINDESQTNKGSNIISSNSLIGLQADFGGGSLPEGWQINELGDPGHSWTFSSNLIWINSYHHEGNHVAGELNSPAIDCSEMDLVLLEIDLNYLYYPIPAGVTDAEIRYSTNGENWQTFYTFTKSLGGTGGKNFEFDLSEVAAGESEFYLKFWFDDQEYLRAYWQIFSVAVYCPSIPELSVDPIETTMNFGTILLEQTSSPQSITIKNVGNGELIVNAPQLNDDTHFSLIYNEADFPANLEFHESISFQMVFHPQEGGAHEAEVNFTYTEEEQGQYAITLTGLGYDPTITNFPWTENFNTYESPPLGWNYVQGIEGSYWQSSGVESYPDGRSIRTYFGPNSGYKANEWLLSPPLDLDQPGAELMYFYVSSNFEPDSITNKLQVWILSDKYDNVEDLEANGEMLAEVYVNEAWERRSIDISSYDGIKYIAFRYYVNQTGGWRMIYLDNLNIEELISYTLTMDEPVGGGQVIPEPGAHSYFAGAPVNLLADTEYAWGWEFEKWEVNGAFYDDQPEIMLVLEENIQVQAFFVPVAPIVLEMHAPTGEGTTLPAIGEHSYKQGAILSVMAYSEPGWEFRYWKKNGTQHSYDNPLLITLAEALTLQAVFEEGPGYSVTFNVYDSLGSPVNQAQIRLNDIQNPAGDYSFDDLLNGTYTYSVLVEGFIPTGGELRLASQNINLDINLTSVYGETHSISFVVSDEEDVDIDDAVVILNGYAALAGSYSFEGFPNGSYPFQIIRSGYLPYEGELNIEGGDLNVQIFLSFDNVLFHEAFEYNIQPGGWNLVIHGDDNRGWEFTDESAIIMPHDDYFVSASLVSPAIDVSEAIALSLKLKHFYNPYMRTTGEIRISEDGLNWHRAKLFSNESQGDNSMSDIDYYLTASFDFGEKIYIAFYYSALNSFDGYYNWKIDDVVMYSPKSFAFEATRASEHLYVETGETDEFKLRIRNIGGLPDVYTLQKINGELNYSIPEIVELGAGNQALTNISFEMPEGLNMGTRDTLVIKIISQSNPQLIQEVTFINAAVAPIHGDYKEDFDIVTVPKLPRGWSRIKNANTTSANVATVNYNDSYSKPNQILIKNSGDLEAELVLILPPLAEDKSLSEFRTRLWLKNSNQAPLIVGTLDHPEGTFTPLIEWVSDNHFTWKEFMFGFEDYEGSDKYVGLKQNTLNTHQGIYIDDIIMEIIPPPIFQISMPSHNFGEGWVNYGNDSIEVTITNKGHYELLVNKINLGTNKDFILKLPQLPVSLKYNETLVFKVIFHPQDLGPITNSIQITYTEEEQSMFSFELEGEALPRPQGSICEDPIFVELPLIDYEGNTEQYGRDYFGSYISPYNIYNYFLDGNDLVMQFTLDVKSLLSGSIGGNKASFFVLESCPNINNPARIKALALDYPGFQSFENIIINPGTYFLVISSGQFKPPFFTDFIVNLSSQPLPDYHMVNFLVMEDSEDEQPLEGVRINFKGELMSGNIFTDISGQISANLLEGNYQVSAFLNGYLEKEIEFNAVAETDIEIHLKDLMFNPTNLDINTENHSPGQALLTWDALPAGEPWTQGFEGDFLPAGWNQIITNPGGLDPILDGQDWKFTWQQYETVYFSDQAVRPIEGQKQAFIYWDSFPQDEWLITHQFKAPADLLEFWYFGLNGSNNQDFFVKISNDDGQTWTSLWNASDLPYGTNYYDYPVFIDLSYYGDQNIRLAWNAIGLNGLSHALMLDAISIGSMKISTDDLIMVSNSQSAYKGNSDHIASFPGQTASSRDMMYVPKAKQEDMFIPKSPRNSRTSMGFEVYLDDMTIPFAVDVQETQYLYSHLPKGEYLAGVRAIYSTGESEIITKAFSITDGYYTSVEDLEQTLSVFPNPASEWITVEATQYMDHYRLINSKGEIISSQIVNSNSTNINVSHLPAGFYILQVYSNKGQMNHVIQVLR